MNLRTIEHSPSSEPAYEQVRQIAAALSADGVTVDQAAVIERLDYRGDPERIALLLRRWRQELRGGSPQAFGDRVPDIVEQTMNSLWQSAKEEASLQIAALRNSADAEIAEATAHRVEALAALKRERQRADDHERDAAGLAKRLAEQDIALAVERERLSQSEAARRAQDAQLASLRDALAAAQTDARRALADAQSAADARDRQRAAELTELRTLNGQAERRCEALDQELQTLRHQHRQTHDQLAQFSVSLKERDRQCKTFGLERDHIVHRVEQLQSQLGRRSAERDAGRERIARLQKELKQTREELAERNQQLQKLSVDVAQARQQTASAQSQLNELIDTELKPPQVDLTPNTH